jgi:hypothetical protein
MEWADITRLLPRNLLHHIRNLRHPSYRSNNKEKNRLRKLPRYKLGSTSLIKPEVEFVDAASFLSAYKQIFENHRLKEN